MSYQNFYIIGYISTPIFLSIAFSLGVEVCKSAFSLGESDQPSYFNNNFINRVAFEGLLYSYRGKDGFIYELKLTETLKVEGEMLIDIEVAAGKQA